MEKIGYVLAVCAIIWIGMSACSSRGKNSVEDTATILPAEQVEQKGPQKMQLSEVTATFTYRGKKYLSTVVRRPDETLPMVKDEQGDLYVDNTILLSIVCGGKKLVDKRFTKQSFASLVEAEFLKHAILEGLVFDDTTDRGLIYAASVAYPQSDLYVPLRLIVSPDGTIRMEKDQLMEEYVPQEEQVE